MKNCCASGLLAVAILSGCTHTWTERPSEPTAEFYYHAMANARRGVVVLYVGDSVEGSQTWTYNVYSQRWQRRHPTEDPGIRAYFALAQFEDGRVVLFGGNNETWIYDLDSDNWEDVSDKIIGEAPPARIHHAMANLDPGKVLLYGGQKVPGNTKLGDTWQFAYAVDEGSQDEYEWIKYPEGSVGLDEPLISHDMAHAGRGKVVMFGGADSQGESNKTYLFENGSWTEVTPERSGSPSARMDHVMAFGGSGANQVYLFGGISSGIALGDLWFFGIEPRIWYRVHDRSRLGGRYGSSMAESSLEDPFERLTLILFNGSTGTLKQDTWTYGPRLTWSAAGL